MKSTLGRVQSLLKGFTPGQLGIIGVAVLALALAAYGLAQWAAQPNLGMLMTGLSSADASAVTTELTSKGVQYQLADGGSTIMVPQSQVDSLRLDVAGKNLISSSSDGYSILNNQSITSTELQQNVAYQHAIEVELQKTLQAITGVQTALVHLAVPTKDVFATSQDKTTASVLLQLQAGTTLSSSQVRAITQLVAYGVPRLDPANVSVTDQTGTLLSSNVQGANAGSAQAGDNYAQTATLERQLIQQAQDVLDKVLGPGHAIVRVNADVNWNQTTTLQENYASPTSVGPTDWSTNVEVYGPNATGTGGALGQTWPTLVPNGATVGTAGYGHWQETANNPINRTLSTAQVAPGAVSRLTVAVVLDAAKSGSLNLGQVQQIVSNAVGLNTVRGDSIQVSQMPFDTTASAAAAKELAAAQSADRLASYVDLGKKAGIGLLLVIATLLFLRRRKPDDTVEAVASDLPYEQMALAAAQQKQQQMLHVPANFAGELTAKADDTESDRRARVRDDVSALVQNQPEDVAQLIQGWLSERKG